MEKEEAAPLVRRGGRTMNRARCTCYVLPHDDDCGLLRGITQSGARVFYRPGQFARPNPITESYRCLACNRPESECACDSRAYEMPEGSGG